MKKKLVVLLAVLMVFSGFTACGNGGGQDVADAGYEAFLEALDIDFSYMVNKTISEMGDDPVLGFRLAGSPAEREAVAFIEKTMKEIGLENVTVDKTTVDGWTFKGANISFENSDGENQTIDLGGYPTTIEASDEKVKVIYLENGIAADYEDVDVKDKLVLIDINQDEDWWINLPAYQAHIKGAKAVLANTEMYEEMDDRIVAQDICGPSFAPALGISQADTDALLEAIEASEDGEIEVVFNADSVVHNDTESQNVWGEIPGKTDEVIYMMAHIDGYFHSFFDDASGVGLILGSAKAMIDSGFEPDKTIRFICHGAEEWGKEDSSADWAAGSLKQITENRPEWMAKAFAVVNIDGAYCVEGETTFGISVAEELYTYIDSLVKPMTDASDYEYRYRMPPSPFKEDIVYMIYGVPGVATASGEETIYYDTAYHSSADSDEVMGFDRDTWLWMHTLYGKIVYAFDALAARPMNFATRFEALMESIDDDVIDDDDLIAKIDEAIEAANPVTEKINALNADYQAAIADEDMETAEELRQEAMALNTELHKIYKAVQDAFFYFDGEISNVIFPHDTRQSNIQNLRGAIEALEEGDAMTAYEDYLSGIGNGWYAIFFDKQTVDYFNDGFIKGLEGTFAEGRADPMDCYVDDIIRTLIEKDENGSTDFTREIEVLKGLEAEQIKLLDGVLEKEKANLDSIINALNSLI